MISKLLLQLKCVCTKLIYQNRRQWHVEIRVKPWTMGVQPFFTAEGDTRYVNWFAGRTYQSNTNWYSKPPKLLWIFYSIHIIYKCVRGSHNTRTAWRASSWRPRRWTFKRILTAGNTDWSKCINARCLAQWLRVSVQTLRETVLKYKTLVVRTHERVK
jgi:hypothetical protein